jgi:hypothetical protein
MRMSLWGWVLIGCLAAWVAPAVVVGLMLGWSLWRHPPQNPPDPESRQRAAPSGTGAQAPRATGRVEPTRQA